MKILKKVKIWWNFHFCLTTLMVHNFFFGDRTSMENLRNGVFRESTILILNFWSQNTIPAQKRKVWKKSKFDQNLKFSFLLDHFDGPQFFFGGRTSLENARNGVFRMSTLLKCPDLLSNSHWGQRTTLVKLRGKYFSRPRISQYKYMVAENREL